jgi:hypothetical protein
MWLVSIGKGQTPRQDLLNATIREKPRSVAIKEQAPTETNPKKTQKVLAICTWSVTYFFDLTGLALHHQEFARTSPI